MMPLRRSAVSAAFGASALLFPLATVAQMGSGDGFLFGAPHGSVTLRGGFARPSAGSDVFSFVQQHLTLSRGDFAGGSFSTDVAINLSERLALEVGTGYSGRSVPSVYRDWVDNKDQEIAQTTALRRMPLTVGVRYYLSPTGRSISRLAWVPTRVATYVAGGAGGTWYSFRQSGDFVDYQTLDVFGTTLKSSSWAPTAYGAVGVDYSMSARTGLVAEARYDHAKARMSRDFSKFDRIDLSGLAATVGLTIRYYYSGHQIDDITRRI